MPALRAHPSPSSRPSPLLLPSGRVFTKSVPPLFQEQLENYDFTKFHSLKPKLIEAVDNMLSSKISSLMSLISQEEMSMPTQLVQGGAFDGTAEGPFNQGLSLIHI